MTSMTTRTVFVPAQREIDADLADHGHIGAKLCAEYGRAAVDVGAPDHDEAETMVTDALANIMHFCDRVQIDFGAALSEAEINHSAERGQG